MKVRAHNPFRKFRAELGLTQLEFGNRCGVSKHAVLRLEQGMYDQPLPSVMELLIANGYDDYEVKQEYVEFQKQTRELTPRLLGHSFNMRLAGCPVGIHPLSHLRHTQGLNQTQFAKMLCISQTVVNNFETKVANQHTVPEQIINALHDNGYTGIETHMLEEWYEAHREHVINKRRPKLIEVESEAANA